VRAKEIRSNFKREANAEKPASDQSTSAKMRISAAADRKKMIWFMAIVVALFVVATAFTQFNPINVLFNMREFWLFIINDFSPPVFTKIPTLLESILETFEMALAATGISVILAFGFSLMGSSVVCKIPFLPKVIRAVASVGRNIPGIVWAVLLSMSFGVGLHVGIIALVLSTFAFLVRAYIETIDEAAGESMEALYACGAGKLAMIFQSIVPAAMPGFISWFLYCIETNIRASTILGMVGAGGVGLLMMSYIKSFKYAEGAAVILVIAAIIIFVNIVTNYIRKKVLL